ncbi:MAG TPA: hypothetical protein VNE83_00140 [Terriglobales bacterium]|nr:hypothetical protein [Terriglobales bacterium]
MSRAQRTPFVVHPGNPDTGASSTAGVIVSRRRSWVRTTSAASRAGPQSAERVALGAGLSQNSCAHP